MTAVRIPQTRFTFNFSYGDATPDELMNVPAGRVVEKVSVVFLVAFDGMNPAIKVGDDLDDERLMPASGNDPTEAATFEAHPGHRYATRTAIKVTITPGFAATQGSGIIIVDLNK